jgi:hypothetical protein
LQEQGKIESMNHPIRQTQGEKGFAPLIIIIVATLVISAGVGGLLLFQEKKISPSENKKTAQQEVPSEDVASPVEPISPPAQSTQSSKPKTQLELKPKSVPPVSPEKTIIVEEDKPPVLKNLAVNMGPWDRQTNRAGDLVFSKNLLFNDGFINNEKAFLEFGEFDHMINNPDRSVEYWWFLSSGTKVRAPADGVVSVGFFEHTKDWGVGIAKGGWTSYGAPIGSKWIVALEHLVNLEVKDGDIVKAGDILGEAAPRKFPGEDFSFVELSVWTGGKDGIFKYCTFEFLDESLKPMYKEKINQLVRDWEEFIGKDVHKQEDWVAPGCLLDKIVER